jgi:anti-sigma factor RsiW
MTDSSEHITCQELVEQVTEYLDGAMPAEEAELLEQHVNFCAGCEWYLDEMRRTIDTGRQLREEHVPDETLKPLLAAFKDWRRT